MQERNIPPLNPLTSVMEFGQDIFMATPPAPTDSSIADDEQKTPWDEPAIPAEADGFLNDFGDAAFNANIEDLLDENTTESAFEGLKNEGLSSENSDDELSLWEDIPDDTRPRVSNFNVGATKLTETSVIENENDISNKIPGFYRMLYLYKDNGVNGLVDKIILSREAMEKFCNEVAPGSFHSETDVDYEKLCKHTLHYVGIYGNPAMIANILFRMNAISENIEKILRNQCESPVDTSNEALPSLRAGIYLYHDKPSGCGLVIHWPEHGAFKENASTDKQKNMINFQRYLFKLTNRQVCLMTKADVASFHWKDEPDGNESFFNEEQNDNICFEFEVQKNQKQKEDFRLREGFQIRIPKPVLYQGNSEFPDLDLRPEILESIHHQTLVTKCLLPASIRTTRKISTVSAPNLKQWIRQTLSNHKLALPENVSLNELRILVKHASPPELFQECFQNLKDASHRLEQRLKGEQQKVLQDANREIDLVFQWVGKNFSRYIQELYMDSIRKILGTIDKSGNTNGQSAVNVAEIKRYTERDLIDDKDMPSKFYNTIHRKLQEYLSNVNDSLWKQKKKRLFFSRQLAYIVWRSQKAEVLSQSEDGVPSTIAGLSRIFGFSFFRKGNQSNTDIDHLSILNDPVPSNDAENAAFVQLFYTIFMDKETRPHDLVRSYLSLEKSSWLAFGKNKTLGDPLDALITEMMGQADRDMNSTPDPEILGIVRDTMNLKISRRSLFPDNNNDDFCQSRSHEFAEMTARIQKIFIDALKKWTNNSQIKVGIKELITRTIKNEASRLNNETKLAVESDIAELKEKSRKEIKEALLTQYTSGHDLFIDRIEEKHRSYIIEYEMATPTLPKLSLSFYETQLDQSDVQKLETESNDDESYRPIPQFYSYGSYSAPVLEYCPQNYSIMKMYQLENGKILCFLRIHQDDSTELYYEKASRINNAIANRTYFKRYTRKFQLTAYDDVNGLLALYSTENGILNVYSFDEKKNDLFMRNPNIQILPWYNNMPPKLSQIVFITGTDDLGFVEISGRVRVFNLIIGQFLPVDGKFPRNSKVRCSPDGACLVAFAVKQNDHEVEIKDTLEDLWIAGKDEDRDEILSLNAMPSDTEGSLITSGVEPSTMKHQSLNPYVEPLTTKEMLSVGEVPPTTRNSNEKLPDWNRANAVDLFAHVFFVNNLKVVSKIVHLPTTENIYSVELSQLAKRQNHLLYITSSYEYFASKILTITIERNEWRFNESNKNSINFGKARLDSSVEGGQIIEGSGTKFLKIEPEDLFVIRGEKRRVKEVLSDTRLIIEGAFPPWLTELITDGFLDFKIDRKPNSNAYIDCYSSVYQRYPIDSCIRDDVEISVSSKNALQIVLGISKEQTVANAYRDRFSKYVEDAFDELTKMTKKPASLLQDFTTSVQSIEEFDIINLCKLSDARPIGQWLIQMSCLLPIQIAVATDGCFVPLKDGVITDMDATLGGMVSLKSVSEAITFGWYESIYNFYGDHEVKVVSSMGEQSTGKSYLLNHLCGSTFDGSAQRCTEGVWMSLVPTKRILYVVMDFEGLRSLERTPQEDMLLTLFNAAVSNLILYKNNFAIGRDISSMFHSFQDGATTFDPSNTSNMFAARLAIIIKDVPKQDRAGIVQEFKSKFSKIVSKEADNNFISRLYNGQMSILPWPVFNDAGFYSGLTELKKYLDNSKPKSDKAHIFLPTIKTIMAKLKVCDWSSLDDSLVRIRASAIRLLIKQVIATGIEGDESASWPLKNRDTGAFIEDEPATFIDIFDVSEITIDDHDIIPDSGLVLLRATGTSFHDLSNEVRNYFESNVQQRSAALEDAKWYKQYITFVMFIIGRRLRRARLWFLINTSRFPSDHTEIAAASNELEQESERLMATWSICGLTCAECNLRCLEQNDHIGKHDCFTDHRCHHCCDFAQEHGFGFDLMDSVQIPPCGLAANHDGSHTCKDSDHLCGELCSLSKRGNCQNACAKQIGHQDEAHMCASRVHYCSEPCSLRKIEDPKLPSQWSFSCYNTCTIPYGDPHEFHKCENNTACPMRCCLPQCNKKCSSKDHFHALNRPTEYHMCGDEHQCFEKCESDGVCEVHTQPQEHVEHYVNSHGAFTYKKWVQTSKRLTCYQKIPAGQLTHIGSHVHAPTDNPFHYCNIKCPFCEYYCTLKYGHSQGEHDTSHGNMIQTFFCGLDDEFEHEGFKFDTGDRGSAFLCKMFCKSQGRHKHIDYCKNTDPTMCNTEGTRHIMKALEPNPHRPKDFVKHSLYWKRTGFKDPYSNEDKELFDKCDALCSGEEHKYKANQNNDSTNPNTTVKSYCELPILHAPLPGGAPLPNGGVGYISSDGHYFKCRNPATANSSFHIIFVIDRSASMRLGDMRPLPESPFANLLHPKHDNRLGAVYDAVYRFMEARQNVLRNRAGGGSNEGYSNDRVSLILFNTKGQTVFANREMVEREQLMAMMLEYHALDGTNLNMGIRHAADICVQHHDPSRIPVIIFLSDGGGQYPTKDIKRLFDNSAKVGAMPYLMTVLFGRGEKTKPALLKAMTEAANNYHKSKAGARVGESELQCQSYIALDAIELVGHFTGIAQSLNEHKPALVRG